MPKDSVNEYCYLTMAKIIYLETGYNLNKLRVKQECSYSILKKNKLKNATVSNKICLAKLQMQMFHNSFTSPITHHSTSPYFQGFWSALSKLIFLSYSQEMWSPTQLKSNQKRPRVAPTQMIVPTCQLALLPSLTRFKCLSVFTVMTAKLV